MLQMGLVVEETGCRRRVLRKAPEPWRRIRVDTREQLPLVFPPGIEAVRGTLATGDYAIDGAPELAVVERKSVADLLGCVGASRERFERELVRLAAFPAAALVIEDVSWPDLLDGRWEVPSAVHPNAVVGSLIAWAQRHGVHVIPAGDRATAARLTAGWLRRAFVESHDVAKVSSGP